jgi:hypothetical protein
VTDRVPDAAFYRDAAKTLHERLGIHHVTLQVEPAEGDVACRLAPEDVV